MALGGTSIFGKAGIEVAAADVGNVVDITKLVGLVGEDDAADRLDRYPVLSGQRGQFGHELFVVGFGCCAHCWLLGVDRCDTVSNALFGMEAKLFRLGFACF